MADRRRREIGAATIDWPLNGEFLVDVEENGKPSKWITSNALRALELAGARP
ncbi:MAG: hypothetical protein HYY06_30525 [Deltaproteobacteria bacterium]|nr:hypothetical protein [Deltaproteobacteria bacterium]